MALQIAEAVRAAIGIEIPHGPPRLIADGAAVVADDFHHSPNEIRPLRGHDDYPKPGPRASAATSFDEFFDRLRDEAVAALSPAAEKAGISPERLVLNLAALCWYPFAHEHTLLPALGMKARDPAFLDEQKRHLGDLVRAMTRPGRERRSRRQGS
jgi:hypothetical protein